MTKVFDYIKSNGFTISQTSVWILSMIEVFIKPPYGNLDNTAWIYFSKFLMWVIIGLMFFPFKKWKKRKYIKKWLLISIFLLIAVVGSFYVYEDTINEKTIEINSKILPDSIKDDSRTIKFVVGNVLNDSLILNQELEEGRKISVEEFIEDYIDEPIIADRIYYLWNRSEVESNSYKLIFLYALNLCLIALLIMCVLHYIQCSKSRI